MLPLLDALARRHGLVGATAPAAHEQPRRFERALLDGLLAGSGVTSVGWNLRALRNCAQRCASACRPRPGGSSTTGTQFEHHLRAVLDRPGPGPAVGDALNVLARADTHLAAHHRRADRPHDPRRRLAPAVHGPADRAPVLPGRRAGRSFERGLH
jgi:hypothetical protein